MKTNYAGIDYSCGLPMANGKVPNIDSNGIRYGIINTNDVSHWVLGDFDAEYMCEDCDDWNSEDEQCEAEFVDCEPIAWNYERDGYVCTFGADDPDMFVIKSPYFTYAQFCSPCAPGACHLNNPLDEPVTIDHETRKATINYPNNKCYCLGEDWFDDEYQSCEYPYWSVETGELVYEPSND
jgi:hypothetical protein